MRNLWQPLLCFLVLLQPAVISAMESLNPTKREPGRQPNILFLMTDDQSFETIGSLGLTDIETPGIDRLVRRGTLLTHAYNMGSWSGAVCVASRTMLITGRSIWDAQRIYDATDKDREAGVLWPQLMKQAGYQTFMTGKWHIQTNAAKVFDLVRDVRGGMPKDGPASYNRPRDDAPDPWSPSDPKFGGFWEGGRHWTEVAADHACDYLTQRKSEAPFFMYVAFNAPHDPRQAPKEFVDRYPLSRIEVPKNFLPEYPFRNDIGCSADLRDEKLGPFPRTEHAVRVHRQEYYAAITHLDSQIGRILDALEASGQADRTWIFLTSDHGLAVGHHGLFGKQNLYDHSVRVPLIVVGPGVAASQRISTPVYLQDIMATSLELARANRPEHVFFQSLLPLLSNPSAPRPYPEIYGAYLRLQRSITVDQMKLIAYPQAGILRLYDLSNDPQEMNDLVAVPDRRAQRDELLQRLMKLQKSLGDQLDLTPLAD